MIDPSPAPPTMLSNIAAILQAIAWPVVVFFFFLVFRSRIVALFDVLTKKIGTATKLKVWQLEIEAAEEDVKATVERVGKAAGAGDPKGKIPEAQVKAAQEVSDRLHSSPLSEERVAGIARRQLQLLASEYDDLRGRIPRGPARTKALDEIVAKMRALSMAARPAIRSFMSGDSAGERLAAVCILQVVPEFGYFHWLVERIINEDQPFLLFQSSVAILRLVQEGQYDDSAGIRQAINDALKHVMSYKGGTPDEGTIGVLNLALSQVR